MAKGHARPRGNGKWQLEVDLGSYTDINGKRRRNKKYKTINAKGQRDADEQLIQFVAKVTGKGYFEPQKINFVDFVNNEWLPKCAKRRLAHTTLETHIYYLELRILPAFQHLRLDQIRPVHIINFLQNLEEEGMRMDKYKDKKKQEENKKKKLSSSTIFYHYRILNNIFNFAKEIKFIDESPLEGIEKPKVEYEETEVYSLEETIEMLKALESETHVPHWQLAVKLAITTGPRRSELFGLDLDKHVDLENRIIHIRQALTYSQEQGYQLHEIKKGSRNAKKRDVVISPTLVEPLRKLRLARKREMMASKNPWEGGKHCLLIADENGKPFHPSSLKNWWKRFLDRHKLKYITIHALRHTSATLLINEGIHPKIISERLGHADIKTTMNIYGHALKQADYIATDKLDSALLGTNEKQ